MQLFIWMQTWKFKQVLTVHPRVILVGFISIASNYEFNIFFQTNAFEWATLQTIGLIPNQSELSESNYQELSEKQAFENGALRSLEAF